MMKPTLFALGLAISALGASVPGFASRPASRRTLSQRVDAVFAPFTKPGSSGGYRAEILRLPRLRTTVMVLSNLHDSDPIALAEAVMDVFLEGRLAPRERHSAEGPALDFEEQTPVTPTEGALAALAGTFYSDELDVRNRGPKSLA